MDYKKIAIEKFIINILPEFHCHLYSSVDFTSLCSLFEEYLEEWFDNNYNSLNIEKSFEDLKEILSGFYHDDINFGFSINEYNFNAIYEDVESEIKEWYYENCTRKNKINNLLNNLP